MDDISTNTSWRKRILHHWRQEAAAYCVAHNISGPLPAEMCWAIVQYVYAVDHDMRRRELTEEDVLEIEEADWSAQIDYQLHIMRMFRATPRPPEEPSASSRARYRAPLERRIELIRFVWERSGAFCLLHLLHRVFGRRLRRIAWGDLFEEWRGEHPEWVTRSQDDMRREFYRVIRDRDTTAEFFRRQEAVWGAAADAWAKSPAKTPLYQMLEDLHPGEPMAFFMATEDELKAAAHEFLQSGIERLREASPLDTSVVAGLYPELCEFFVKHRIGYTPEREE